MACKIEIKQNLTDEITKRVQEDAIDVARLDIAKKKADNINKLYKHTVVRVAEGQPTNKIGINIPSELVDEYYDYFIAIEEQEARDVQKEDAKRAEQEYDDEYLFHQKKGIQQSKANPKTLKLINEFLKRSDIDVQSLQKIYVNGVKQDANGAALIMQKLIQVVEGKEAEALPEEAMHFAVEIIEQNNPKLFMQMLKDIGSYALYKDVLRDYSGDKSYQTKEGKPDIRKLKKEAIAKVLAETVINKNEGITEHPELLVKVQTWWQKIVEFLKGMFSKSGFDKAAMDIVKGKDIGELSEESVEIYLQKSAENVFNDLKQVASQITLKNDKYQINGKEIPKRVSDEAHDWYSNRFKDNDLTKDEYDKAVDELKREKGTKGHSDLEHAFSLFVDEEGILRENPLDDGEYVSQLDPNNSDFYDTLKQNLHQRLLSYPEGTRFLSEITVYNPKKNVAGTIDFLAILPDGKTNILDWKFMNLNTDRYSDIPWYKIKAWNIQMKQYKSILEEAYGLDKDQFGQTRMIPILAEYTKLNKKENILPRLKGVKIGDVNVQNITEDYLLPLGLPEERTGNKKIDTIIDKLNAEYQKFSERTVKPEERQAKAEHLNALYRAIRHLQIKQDVQPLLNEAKVLNKRVKTLIDKYHNNFEGKDPNSITEQEKNEFADEIEILQQSLNTYTDIDTYLKDIVKDDKELRKGFKKTADKARSLEIDLINVKNEFASDIIVKSEGINNFLDPEKIVKGISRLFSSTATIQTKAIQFLYKKANKALGYASLDTLTEIKRLQELKEKYDGWARNKGLKTKNYFDILKKKNSNELIDEYKKDFYTTLRKKIEEKDFKWIRENVDNEKYKEFIEEKLTQELERIDNKPRIGTKKEIENEIRREKEKAEQLYNASSKSSNGWLLYDFVKQFPKETWQSDEWIELNKPENKPAKDFYDYIREKNDEYRKLGYINAREARVFLPYVRKGLTEALITGANPHFGERFFRSISVDEGDVGYGKIDPHTGEPIDVIPKYFTREIEGEVSDDLFKTMALYNESALRYKYLMEIEAQVNLVLKVEQSKKAIATSIFGKTSFENGELRTIPDNSENSKLLQDMIKGIIYGQRYIKSETFDQLLGKLGTLGGKFNKVLGVNVFPENLSERQMSVNKVIDSMNNLFQMEILGLNLASATSNLFGGNSHSLINAGKYFTKKDYIASEARLLINKFNGDDAKKYIAALEYFLPLTDNYNRHIAKKLTVNTLTAEGLQDFLMILMRNSDWNVQTANFYAYLSNTIVDEGEVKNVREYLRTQPKYQKQHLLSSEQRKALKEEFEEDVKKLMEEKGVMNISSIENGQLVIPGVERLSQSVIELRRKVQQISKNALGNLTADDLRRINMTIYGKSFMIFKNWIPRLIDVRMGNMKYNAASDAYEWGRMRMIFRVLSDDLFHSIGNLKNSLIANEKGVDYMRQLFEKKAADYLNDTGKVLEMTEDEFIDMVRHNIRSQIIDVIFLSTLTMLLLALKAFQPDDKEEDPAVKSQYRFMMRMTDKLRDELLYFYNPTNLASILKSGGIFPSLAYVENFEKAATNFFKENWGIVSGNEDLIENTKVIKYWMKAFPFTNQMVGYLPMFYPALAKDLGVRIQSNYGSRR